MKWLRLVMDKRAFDVICSAREFLGKSIGLNCLVSTMRHRATLLVRAFGAILLLFMAVLGAACGSPCSAPSELPEWGLSLVDLPSAAPGNQPLQGISYSILRSGRVAVLEHVSHSLSIHQGSGILTVRFDLGEAVMNRIYLYAGVIELPDRGFVLETRKEERLAGTAILVREDHRLEEILVGDETVIKGVSPSGRLLCRREGDSVVVIDPSIAGYARKLFCAKKPDGVSSMLIGPISVDSGQVAFLVSHWKQEIRNRQLVGPPHDLGVTVHLVELETQANREIELPPGVARTAEGVDFQGGKMLVWGDELWLIDCSHDEAWASSSLVVLPDGFRPATARLMRGGSEIWCVCEEAGGVYLVKMPCPTQCH